MTSVAKGRNALIIPAPRDEAFELERFDSTKVNQRINERNLSSFGNGSWLTMQATHSA